MSESQRTAAEESSLWTHGRAFAERLKAENGSSLVLLAAAVLGLLWANVSAASYESFWTTELYIGFDSHELALTLREWVNSGLMAFFFFVVGLEARRELDLGEFRTRRNLLLPVAAGVAGMAAAGVLYLLVTWGTPEAAGWGVPLSTDTAFALGVLAVVGRGNRRRLRAFLLSVVITDDIVILLVIAFAFTESVQLGALAVAAAAVGAIVALAMRHIRGGAPYLLLGAVGWVALHESGIDPVIIGLVVGLLAFARRPDRETLADATTLFVGFREQPTAAAARDVQTGLRSAVSPNERMLHLWEPWSAYVVVPVFALANTGFVIPWSTLGESLTAPVTVAVVLGLVLGKPLGVALTTWLGVRLSRGRLRTPVGWAGVLGTATVSGVGFTLSLLIATLAFEGEALDDAKLGVVVAALVSTALTWLVFQVVRMLPDGRRETALFGSSALPSDLADDVDPDRDHVRGDLDGEVTLVEYADFECPYCGLAEPIVESLLEGDAGLRYVWRHLPLREVHPHAQLAAEAAEAAGSQGRFWEMHDVLLDHQGRLTVADLMGYASDIGLDVDRFTAELKSRKHAGHVDADVETADASQVTATPTFFINGQRYTGPVETEALREAVALARQNSRAAAALDA